MLSLLLYWPLISLTRTCTRINFIVVSIVVKTTFNITVVVTDGTLIKPSICTEYTYVLAIKFLGAFLVFISLIFKISIKSLIFLRFLLWKLKCGQCRHSVHCILLSMVHGVLSMFTPAGTTHKSQKLTVLLLWY